MGIADQMGWQNPFTQFVGNNRNTLMGFGAGLASGPTFGKGVAAGLQGAQQGKMTDTLFAQQKEEKAKATEQTNATRSWLEQQGFTDLVPLVDAGQADIAYSEALKRMQPGYGQAETVKPIEVNGQLVDPATGRVIGDYRDPDSGQSAAPAGYQWNPDGTQAFIPGGPADPSTAGKTTEATRRNQQLAKVIAPEAAALLGDPATGKSGTFDALADTGNQGWNAVGLGSIATSPEYQQAQNSLKTIIASYLYSVSGATANPGEVENQAAILTPRPGESAQSVSDKKARIAVMVQAVQDAATGASMPPQTGGNVTSSGLQWSIEP